MYKSKTIGKSKRRRIKYLQQNKLLKNKQTVSTFQKMYKKNILQSK